MCDLISYLPQRFALEIERHIISLRVDFAAIVSTRGSQIGP